MTDRPTDEVVDHLRKCYRDDAEQAKKGGRSFVPVRSAEDTADALDELARRRSEAAEWDGEIYWPKPKERRVKCRGVRIVPHVPFSVDDD
jgi:hypothetical protein